MSFRYSILFVTICFFFIFISCKSVPSKNDIDDTISENLEKQVVSLKMPEKPVNQSVFPTIDNSIIELVENGSLASLRTALSKLRSPDQVYTDEQIILLNMISSMMSFLYPSEKITWPIPTTNISNNYLAALDSVKKGIYDYNAGNEDFFSLTLPSLILFSAPSVKNYYADSEKALLQAFVQNKNSFLVDYLLGVLYFMQKRYNESMQYLEKAYNIDSSCIVMAQYYAITLQKNGRDELANSVSKKILEQDPTNSEILKVSAYSSYASGNLAKAEEYVIRILQQEPDNSEYLLLRIQILMDKNEYLNVSSLLDLYSKTDNSSKRYLLLRAKLQRDWNKNYAAASATIQQALENYPKDEDVLLFAASLMSFTGQKIGQNSIKEVLNSVLQIDQNNEQAKQLLINEYFKDEQWQAAYNLSSPIVQSKSSSSGILLLHIKTCLKLGLVSEARKNLQQMNAKQDDYEYILVNVQVLIAEENVSEARKIIQTALDAQISSKEKSAFYYEKSRISNSSEQKLSDLRSCLTINPRNQDALFDLYSFYYQKQDYRKAQYYLRQVVALNPTNTKLNDLNNQLTSLIK